MKRASSTLIAADVWSSLVERGKVEGGSPDSFFRYALVEGEPPCPPLTYIPATNKWDRNGMTMHPNALILLMRLWLK